MRQSKEMAAKTRKVAPNTYIEVIKSVCMKSRVMLSL